MNTSSTPIAPSFFSTELALKILRYVLYVAAVWFAYFCSLHVFVATASVLLSALVCIVLSILSLKGAGMLIKRIDAAVQSGAVDEKVNAVIAKVRGVFKRSA